MKNPSMKPIATAKRVIFASMLSLTLFSGAATTGLLSEPAPAYAERGSRAGAGAGITTAPTGTTTGTAERVVGHPKTGGPGQATGAECRAYAEAKNAIDDQLTKDLLEGTPSPGGPGQLGAVGAALLQAGGARGCVFMQVD
jgi:hypothetical protein